MIKKLLILLTITIVGQLAHAQQNIDSKYIEQHYAGWYILHPEAGIEPQCMEFEESSRCINRQIKELTAVIENQVAAAPTRKTARWKTDCQAKVDKFMKKVDESPAKELMRLAYTRDIYKEYLVDMLKKAH